MSTPGSLRAALDQMDEIGIADHVQSLEWDRAGARTTAWLETCGDFAAACQWGDAAGEWVTWDITDVAEADVSPRLRVKHMHLRARPCADAPAKAVAA